MLRYHGGSFAESFWKRVFDSVLLPIFDHVRAEVGGGVLDVLHKFIWKVVPAYRIHMVREVFVCGCCLGTLTFRLLSRHDCGHPALATHCDR